MDGNYELEKRKYVIGGAAAVIIIVYLIRLFTLQLLSEDFKISADSNAFLKRIQYPARGSISDRNGKLLVYNQPAYDVMVIMNEQVGVDTLDLCESLDITREWYERRMEEIKDRRETLPLSWLLHSKEKHSPIQLSLCGSPAWRRRRGWS